MPYKYALNNLTQAEMIALTNRQPQEKRKCEYCGEEFWMRQGQRFCCPAHRTAMGRLISADEGEQLRKNVARLEKEKEVLVKEILSLRKQLALGVEDEWYMQRSPK